MLNDPWVVSDSTPAAATSIQQTTQSVAAAFEDDFQPLHGDAIDAPHSKLPDSDEYLESLQRKLNKLKSGTDVLQQLTSRREHCMESLLRGSITLPTDADFGLDSVSGDTETGRTEELIRHIIPERAIHPVELIHLINYDQLQPPTDSDEDTANETNSDNVSR